MNNAIFSNRGFCYADGFFSTMGVYQGGILYFSYHKNRLISHSQALQLNIDIEEIIQQLTVHAQQINEGIIKIVITRANQAKYGVRGYGFVTDEVEIFIQTTAQKMPSYQQLFTKKFTKQSTKPIPINPPQHAICLQSQIACLPKPLVGLKSLNRLDSVLVAGELEQAKKENAKLIEGLVSDISGDWVEGVISNVFYQLNHSNEWHTPPIDKSGVNGVMRNVLIDYYQNNGQAVSERRLTTDDLTHISAMFFCNAIRGIMPIEKLWLTPTIAHSCPNCLSVYQVFASQWWQ
ncbi:MAG: aminotransferase class IV [Moraxellaceae bacterium]|nr:aminotransferase class IV [Moraxellaceae bacterium]